MRVCHEESPEIPRFDLRFVLSAYIVRYDPGNQVHGANIGPTWVLSAPDGPLCLPHEPCYQGIYFHVPHDCLSGIATVVVETFWRIWEKSVDNWSIKITMKHKLWVYVFGFTLSKYCCEYHKTLLSANKWLDHCNLFICICAWWIEYE